MKLSLLSLSAVLSGIVCIVVQVICNGVGVFGMLGLLGLVVVFNPWPHEILWCVVRA